MGANPPRPTDPRNLTQGTTPIKFHLWASRPDPVAMVLTGTFHCLLQIGNFTLNICRIWLQMTSHLLVGSTRSSPALPAPRPGVVQDMGCWMPPHWGLSGGLAPLKCLEKEASSGWEQTQGAALWGDSQPWPWSGASEQHLDKKTFIEMLSKCTEGYVYPAAYNCFFGKIPST